MKGKKKEREKRGGRREGDRGGGRDGASHEGLAMPHQSKSCKTPPEVLVARKKESLTDESSIAMIFFCLHA